MRTVRLKTPEPGGAYSGASLEITDDEGRLIHGVSKAQFTAEVDSVCTVLLKFHAAKVDVAGVPTFYMQHPETGRTVEIKSIEFADGTRWPA